MQFADFVCSKAIIPELKARDRDGAIVELISALDKAGKLGKGNCEKIANAMIERENEASTGMGKGVAVPHVKYESVKNPVVAIGQSSAGIDFFSLDKKPVYSVILLISPSKDPDRHLQVMEKVFKHLQQEKFRKWLRQSQSVEQIEELLKDSDEGQFLD